LWPSSSWAVAAKRTALAHSGRERILDRVSGALGVAGDARRDADEDLEATAVQRLQVVQARSAASDHTSLTLEDEPFL
jgi:hypothetical protein